jgi:hypothetical protein
MINGTRGTLILDTGATYVALKNAFAQKAKVEIEQDSSVRLNTANGLAEGKRGRAKIIQLRSLQAKDVPIVVQTESRGGRTTRDELPVALPRNDWLQLSETVTAHRAMNHATRAERSDKIASKRTDRLGAKIATNPSR